MAELEVDQTNLPPIQEVSQYFALLEDGALAHNLQEQEIEQFYSSNVQRNQLVQKDIRVAKRLQNEEHQQAQMLHCQASQQLEEQDSKYAQRIQEEIQQSAKDAQRREEEDKEIAKRIQEEEELLVIQRNGYKRKDNRESGNIHSSANRLRTSQPLIAEEQWQEWPHCSMQHSTSSSSSDCDEDDWEGRRPGYEVYCDAKPRHGLVNEPPVRNFPNRISRRTSSQNNMTGQVHGGWSDIVRLIKNDMSKQGYTSYSSDDELFEPVYELERVLSQKHGGMREQRSRTWQERHVRTTESSRDIISRYSRSIGGQRHVHFQDDWRSHHGYRDRKRTLNENREVMGVTVGSFPITVNESTINDGMRQNLLRKRYERDNQLGVRSSLHNENRSRNQTFREPTNRVASLPFQTATVTEIGEDNALSRFKKNTTSTQLVPSSRNVKRHEGRKERCYSEEHNKRSEQWQANLERRSSTEDEEMESNRQAPRLTPSSFSLSCQECSPRAGLGRDRTCLDLGEIQQVLQDEELAHRLQEEEEKLLRQASRFRPSSLPPCPEGDFRVAQVAQDEEIAHFMLEQEMKSQMLPQKLEDCESERECRAVNHAHDVSYREMHSMGLNSEETVSPCNEFSQQHQPPIAATPTVNIAEELDPTFQREEQMQAGQNPSEPCQLQTTPQAWVNGEPTFVAPTKRQNDKSEHVKSKQKRKSFKRKPSCKQQ